MKIDFHIHTSYSYDSFSKPKIILKYLKKSNMGGIAVTDHHKIAGAFYLKKINKTSKIIILGTEIKTEYGDIIGIFLNQKINKTIFLEVLDEIKSQDGLVVLPHPFKKNHLRVPEKYIKKIDFIETLNSRIKPSQNLKADDLANSFKKNKIAGSDAHLFMEIGNAYLEVGNKNEIYEEEEIRKKILKGQTIVCGKETQKLVSLLSKGLGKIAKSVKNERNNNRS